MKLYGGPLSNYFNMARHAMLEKALAFEIVPQRPGQDAEFLARSPMGKIPVLETPQGFLTETDAILDYLEEAFPDTARLFPVEPFARARVRQLMKTQELYVETPAHTLIGALFNREVPVHVQQSSRIDAAKGMAALGRLVKFGPWIAGAEFTCADIFVFYSFTLSNRLTQLVHGWDLLQELPGLSEWYERVGLRPVTQQIMADQQAATATLAMRISQGQG
jgi:glutathione S-transferase